MDDSKIDEETIKRITAWALGLKHRQQKQETIELRVKEIQKEYERAMNKILFDYTINAHDPSHGSLFSFLEGVDLGEETNSQGSPR